VQHIRNSSHLIASGFATEVYPVHYVYIGDILNEGDRCYLGVVRADVELDIVMTDYDTGAVWGPLVLGCPFLAIMRWQGIHADGP
jgi:hypothetical protein